MKLGTHMQVLTTNTPAKFQGHPPTITPLPLTCVVFKVIAENVNIAFYPYDYSMM